MENQSKSRKFSRPAGAPSSARPARSTKPGPGFKKPYRRDADQGKMVYIGNLKYSRDAGGIEWLFAKYGKVENVKIVVTPGTEESKGYAFVKMKRSKDADKAIKALDGKQIDGRSVKVSEAAPQANPKKAFKKKDNYSFSKPLNDASVEEEEKKFVPRKRKRNDLNDLLTYLGKA